MKKGTNWLRGMALFYQNDGVMKMYQGKIIIPVIVRMVTNSKTKQLTGKKLEKFDLTERKDVVAKTTTRLGTRAFVPIDWSEWKTGEEALKYFARITKKSSDIGRLNKTAVTEMNVFRKMTAGIRLREVTELSTLETIETMARLVAHPTNETEEKQLMMEFINNLLQTVILRILDVLFSSEERKEKLEKIRQQTDEVKAEEISLTWQLDLEEKYGQMREWRKEDIIGHELKESFPRLHERIRTLFEAKKPLNDFFRQKVITMTADIMEAPIEALTKYPFVSHSHKFWKHVRKG